MDHKPIIQYPQTLQSVRAWIVANGLSQVQVAELCDVPHVIVRQLLRRTSATTGVRGNSHKAAVMLGLKPVPGTPAALDPNNLPAMRRAPGAADSTRAKRTSKKASAS